MILIWNINIWYDRFFNFLQWRIQTVEPISLVGAPTYYFGYFSQQIHEI